MFKSILASPSRPLRYSEEPDRPTNHPALRRTSETGLRVLTIALLLLASILSGCTIHPPGEKQERDAAARLGKPFEKQVKDRDIPPLPENPTPEQLVQFALLNNADLEQKYWGWRAAIEQIPQDGTQSTNLNIAAGTTITKGHASWGASTVTLGNDPMTDIKWPGKLDLAAKQSLEAARAAGRRFVNAKYALRGKVLGAYYDFALDAQLLRLEQANAQLLDVVASTTAARNRAGSMGQQDVLKARNQLDLSRNDIANLQSQLMIQQAALNSLMDRPPQASPAMPMEQPPPRAIAYTDAQLLALAAKHNPELAALADEIAARQDGIRLAQLQYFPDFNLSVGTDLEGMAQSLLGQATVPLFRYEAINASVAQAQANLRGSQAMLRQSGNDLASQVVADIVALRDQDRQLDLFGQTILPRARQVIEIERAEYETGQGSLLEMLDAQRSLISIERLVATLRAGRDKWLVDLEAITTVDLSSHAAKPTALRWEPTATPELSAQVARCCRRSI